MTEPEAVVRRGFVFQGQCAVPYEVALHPRLDRLLRAAARDVRRIGRVSDSHNAHCGCRRHRDVEPCPVSRLLLRAWTLANQHEMALRWLLGLAGDDDLAFYLRDWGLR